MKKEQLNVLLKHGELWTDKDFQIFLSKKYVNDSKGLFGVRESKLYKGNDLRESGYRINIQGMEYNLDKKLYSVLEQLFEWYLSHYLSDGKEFIEQDIKEQFKVYSPLIEDRKRFLGDKILELNKDLKKLIGDPTRLNPVKMIKERWCDNLLETGEDLIQCLKFEVMNGERIQGFDFPYKKHLPNFYKLEKFFQTNKILKIFQAQDIVENITYLKKLIEDLEKTPEGIDVVDNDSFLNHSSEENIFCKGMPIEFAIDHFKKFTEPDSKKGTKFLTPEQLNNFISKAFLGNVKLEKQNFNYSRGERRIIKKHFYFFYTKVMEKKYDLRPTCRDYYISLLSDNFNDFTFKNVKDNFKNK